jgi:hypothetical protein
LGLRFDNALSDSTNHYLSSFELIKKAWPGEQTLNYFYWLLFILSLLAQEEAASMFLLPVFQLHTFTGHSCPGQLHQQNTFPFFLFQVVFQL